MMSPGDKFFTVLTCYYRPKPGGFCKRLFRAIKALLDRGHTVHYLAVVPFPIDHPNCHFHRFPWPEDYTSGYLFWAFFHLFAPVQLFFLGFRYRINRMFAFGGHNYALFLQPLRIIRRIPLTLFLRGDALENHRLKGHHRTLVGLEHLLEGLSIAGTRLYGVSETLLNKTIARHRFLKPLISGVLRNDIVCNIAISEKSKKAQLPLRLACVGLLEPRKNQRFLLNVMEEIKAEQAQLYLYGVGPDEQFLKEMVEQRKLMDRVHFMGWVAAEDIWPETDLLLMPSLHEGAPNAVLEALGYEIPVLASDIPEHAEILPQKGLLSIDHPDGWIRFLTQDGGRAIEEINIMSNRQAISADKLYFNWENIIVELISKK